MRIPAVISGKQAQLVLKDYKVVQPVDPGTGWSKIVYTYNGALNLTLDKKVLPSTITEKMEVYNSDGYIDMGMTATYEITAAD